MSLVVVTGALVFFASCGGDDPKPTEQQVQLDKLKKTWTLVTPNGAKLGTTDRTGDFTGFSLTIAGTFNSSSPNSPTNATLTVSGTRPDPSPWPGTSQWEFMSISGNTGKIKRSADNIEITYAISSNGRLTLVFECTACNHQGSRTMAVNGVWTFEME